MAHDKISFLLKNLGTLYTGPNERGGEILTPLAEGQQVVCGNLLIFRLEVP